MRNIEQQQNREGRELPKFLTRAMISLLLLVGAGVGYSAADTSRAESDISPVTKPTPDRNAESNVIATPDNRITLDFTPTPSLNQETLTPEPRAAQDFISGQDGESIKRDRDSD